MNILQKYAPKTIEEIEVNKEQAIILMEFMKNFRKQKKKAMLAYGPTGTGKTSHVYTIARELQLEIFEVNSSDFRNAESLQQRVGNASKQKSLFAKGKILLVDELDGISGQEDRGGLQALVEIIEQTQFPIVITANDIEMDKFASLFKKVTLLEFKAVEKRTIYNILRRICEKENIKYTESDLANISAYAQGDIRSALIDLGSSFQGKKITLSAFEARNKKENAVQTTINLFQSKGFLESLKELENSDEYLVDISRIKIPPILFTNEHSLIYLLEENLQTRDAFNSLSRADIFHGRIMRRQYWRLLSYIPSYLAFSSLNQTLERVKKSSRSPKNNFRLWSLINKNKTASVERLARMSHCSKAKANKEIYPFLKTAIKQEVI
ncbi:AAA family ATPase [Candidatus Woesearchaeota archaeon]|nr:AAA family ATPase [Candidatus Woesearchaeota archaeon]